MKNEAALIGYYGGDERVCISAWQSTGHELGLGDLQAIPVEQRTERLFIETMKTKKKTPRDLLLMLGQHGHHCYDDKTEILTRQGWKLFADLADDDLVCAVDPKTLEAHFERPERIYVGDYDEPMYYVKGQQLDIAVTKNHRMLVSQKRMANGEDYGTVWESQTSQEVSGQTRKYLKSAQIINEDVFEPEVAKFIGFFIGDGHCPPTGKFVDFNLKKQRKIEYLNGLGFFVKQTGIRNDGLNYFKVEVADRQWFRDECYDADGNKKLPGDIFSYSKSDVESILDGLKNSDGSKRKRNSNEWTYYTTSEILKEQLLTLACLHNFVFTERKPFNQEKGWKPCYRLGYSERVAPEISNMKSRKIGKDWWEWYTGKVYCVTVSTGFVMVRRSGKTVISSNTPFEKIILDFQITSDIASHVHILKHRISSVNAECLTGDSEITFVNCNGSTNPKLRKTVKYLFDKWTQGRSHQKSESEAEYAKKRIKNMRLRVLDEETNLFTIGHIKDIWFKGIQDVYQVTLENGKKLKVTENHALFTNEGFSTIDGGLKVGDLVGCNGVTLNVIGRPWTFASYFENSEEFTRHEFANFKGIKYDLLKKWGYIHNAKFKDDPNKSFKKGQTPWNKGVTGYKLNITEQGLKARRENVRKYHSGENSHFWRGGVTSDRALIGEWTRRNARQIHEKYEFTCQSCGEGSGNLHAHHIIPVSQDESKAYDLDNLITVCQACHSKIHYSVENEIKFAAKVLDLDFRPLRKQWKTKSRVGKKLAVDYSPIISIIYIGKEETFDIEVEGDLNNNFVANGIVVHNSARYKELPDKWYTPFDWGDEETKIYEDFMENAHELYHEFVNKLQPTLGRRRAKESARFVLPYGKQLTYDLMINMRSFANMVKLRADTAAQIEIQILVRSMLRQVYEQHFCGWSLEALGLLDYLGDCD